MKDRGDAAGARLPARAPDLALATFDVDTVVHDPRSGEVHLVEGFAAIVLEACDEGADRAALVGDVVAALGVTEVDAQDLVAAALRQLDAADLLA